jgi:hypothetical protein
VIVRFYAQFLVMGIVENLALAQRHDFFNVVETGDQCELAYYWNEPKITQNAQNGVKPIQGPGFEFTS